MERKDYHKYSYNGPVEEFGRCIMRGWSAVTYAPSEKKALSNLKFQFNSEYHRAPSMRISLPGAIRKVW